ncbi:MAG: hypothetical protein U0941_25275 [Planctomycetaceae bacterium]
MERFLQNLDVWCWRYKENVHNYPGLHFTARPQACDALLTCLTLLQAEGSGSYRTVPLKSLFLRDEAKVTGGQAFEAFTRLRITVSSASDHLRQMSFYAEGSTAHFDLAERGLILLRSGIEAVKRGEGDYSIYPSADKKHGLVLGEQDHASERLWFWPCFGHFSD